MSVFRVYRSSAGSGKTFNLVREYLILCLASEVPSYSRYILALTFTNKAADEMKSRILKALEELSSDASQCKYTRELVAATGLSADELTARADTSLKYILHHYSEFSVGTIDRFIYRMIRTFSRDLQLDGEAAVEMDVQALIERCVSLVLSRAGEDEVITRSLRELALYKIAEDKGYKVDSDLESLMIKMRSEKNRRPAAQLMQVPFETLNAIILGMKSRKQHMVAEIKEAAQDCFNQLRACGNVDDYSNRSRGIYGFVEKIQKGYFSYDSVLPDINGNAIKSVQNGVLYSSDVDKPVKERILSNTDVICVLFNKLVNAIEKNRKEFAFISLTMPHVYTLSLLRSMEEAMKEITLREQLLPITEFNALISDVIQNEPVPFIYERLGERYKHFMLDEFQDTSVMQWQNMLPLVANALSEGGTALLFGDTKQAIYRWRNGEARQFAAMPNLYPPTSNTALTEHASVLKQYFVEQPLNANFRSYPIIVEFNNALFSDLLQDFEVLAEMGYQKENVVQRVASGQTGGYVFIKEANAGLTETERFAWCKGQIDDCVQRGYAFNDIVILVRNNGIGTELAAQLVSQNIPVVSEECLSLTSSTAMHAIMALVTWLNDIPVEVKGLYLHMHLFGSHSLNAPHTFIMQRELQGTGRLYKSRFDVPQMLITAGLPSQKEIYSAPSVNGLIMKCARELKIDISNPYLQTLMDQVHSLSQQFGFQIIDLLKWWDEKAVDVSVGAAGNSNAIRIMTIHKSKGLEFPVVLMPSLDWPLEPQQDYIWVPATYVPNSPLDELLAMKSSVMLQAGFDDLKTEEDDSVFTDNINLLYVAFTRAVRELRGMMVPPVKENHKRIHTTLRQQLQKLEGWNATEKYFEKGMPLLHHQVQVETIHNAADDKEQWDDAFAEISFLSPVISTRRRLGDLIHKVMSMSVHKEDLIEVLENYSVKFNFDSEILEAARIQLEGLLKQCEWLDEIYPQAGWKMLNEKSIVAQNGSVLRPDRILVKNNEAIVVDFKTGAENRNEYSLQMKLYADALSNMGFLNISLKLVYTEQLKIEEVPYV